MGAVCCKPEDDELGDPTFGSTRVKSWKRHKWRSDEPVTESQLQVALRGGRGRGGRWRRRRSPTACCRTCERFVAAPACPDGYR